MSSPNQDLIGLEPSKTEGKSCIRGLRIRLLFFAGSLYLMDVIWGTVSLHAWLYLSSGIAGFYSLRGLSQFFNPMGSFPDK